jgi:drug/metabolite transporter (DMT)-like permease
MSRLRADLCLLLTAIIWGGAFIAQKTGMNGLGPFGFTGARFVLSFLVVLPFALKEARKAKALTRQDWIQSIILCTVFFLGVVMQQVGMMTTTVTNAGFLTVLYVVLVPFVAMFMFRRRPHWITAPACLMAFAGIWLLGGGSLSAFRYGDWLMLLCAVCFAVQVPLIGLMVQRTGRPLTFAVMQYAACAVAGLAVALACEGMSVAALQANLVQIGYAGLISGGIAYTLQAVAQQHTPPSDAAVILSGESFFAAIFGILLLGEHLTSAGRAGCALILAAMLLVETGVFLPAIFSRFRSSP